MKKFLRIISIVLCLTVLCGCTREQDEKEDITPQVTVEFTYKALWLSVYEFSDMINHSRDKEEFSDEADLLIEKCIDNNINILFIHVRAFNDSLYPSAYTDWSAYVIKSPDYDPLKILTEKCRANNIEAHAWLNPYRVSYDSSYKIDDAFRDFSVNCKHGVYLLPSSVESMKLILFTVRELLENYDIDGIHFDDYFYPSSDKDFDDKAYKEYRNQGGALSLGDWRRESVNTLMSAVYSLVHHINPEAVFSISPAADIDKNYNVYYADVELWLESYGYADWIIPQVYFGFNHQTTPFIKTCEIWSSLKKDSSVKLICGLAVYKQGEEDGFAGFGKDEWIENQDIIERQISYLANSGKWNGYALFSYDSIV